MNLRPRPDTVPAVVSAWLVVMLLGVAWIGVILIFVALCRAAASGDASLRHEMRARRA